MSPRMGDRRERGGGCLAADGAALIRGYECTFCEGCAAEMNRACPDHDELVARPRREAP